MLKLLIILLIVGLLFIFCYRRLLNAAQKVLPPAQHSLKKKRLDAITAVDPEAMADRELDAASNQLLFDQIAELFFEKKIMNYDRNAAEQIQQLFLNKMPAQCFSQIGEFDLGEWSIFWTYKQQSLEYYVARYGVFYYTHVDRFGVEHKFKCVAEQL